MSLKREAVSWQLQTAKNRFSEVVEKAMKEGPQTVTKHGKPAVVVVSHEEYAKGEKKSDLLDWIKACPEDLSEIIPPRSTEAARPSPFEVE